MATAMLAWCMLAATASFVRAQVDAISTARYDLRMGFTVDGRLLKVEVEAGDRVKAGDILMELEDHEGQAMVLQYTLKANSDLAIRSAQEQLKLARIEAKAIKELFDKNAATPIELDRANVKAIIAELEVENARQMLEEARHMLAQAKARHERYILRAPIDGVIDTLVGRPGESIESIKPIVRLVNTDKLYIDAPVPTSQTLALKPGDDAWVKFKILPDAEPVVGKILYLAQVADSASDTRLVRIETPNPHKLPAGGVVTVWFEAPQPVAKESDESSHTPDDRQSSAQAGGDSWHR